MLLHTQVMLYYYICNPRINCEYHMRLLPVISCLALTPVAAFADVPKVATDIAPVHSLVAQVMGDLGTPDLILPPGASPHGYAMRPSEAAAISRADLVVWVGEALTPWLERPVENLGNSAAKIELLSVEGTLVLEGREDAVFAAAEHDEHGHEGHGHDDHGHDEDHGAHEDHDAHADHDDHSAHKDHDDHTGHDHSDHDDHKEETVDAGHHDHGHAHNHGGTDPHAWLDPANASVWLGAIAAALSDLDPENAAIYAANATAGQAELASLVTEITAQLAPVADRPHVVFHDAYQYFEGRFGTTPLGAISISDASAPSAARLSELRAALTEAGVVCAFAEPQFDPRLVVAVTEGTPSRTAVLDPIGIEIPLGATFYGTMIREMAQAKLDCLSDG